MKLSTPYLIAGAAVLGALVWASTREGGMRGIGSAVVGGAIDLVDGAISEPIFIIGEAVGIPRTDPDRCADAKAKNNLWEVSKHCGVVDYFKAIPGAFGTFF